MNIDLKHRPLRGRWEMHVSPHCPDPESKFMEIWNWCCATFGHPGTDPDTGVKSEWDYHGGWLYFYDEKYVTMFVLRWS